MAFQSNRINDRLWEDARNDFGKGKGENVVQQLENYVKDQMKKKTKDVGDLVSPNGRGVVLDFIMSNAMEHEAKQDSTGDRSKKVCEVVNKLKPSVTTAAGANPIAGVAVAGLFFAFELYQIGRNETRSKFEVATDVANFCVLAGGHSNKTAPATGEQDELAKIRELLRQAYINLYSKMLGIMAGLLADLSPDLSRFKRTVRKVTGSYRVVPRDGAWSEQLSGLRAAYGEVEKNRMSVDDYSRPSAFHRGGRNALHHAAYDGRTSDLYRILDDGRLDIDGKSPRNWTALMFASRNGHSGCVDMLLARELDLYATDNIRQETALAIATRRTHIEVVKAILERERVDRKKGGHPNLKRLVDLKNKEGRTALFDTAERLINLNNKKGPMTLSDAAREQSYIKIVKHLCKASENIDQICTGRTAFLHAAEHGHIELIKILHEAGADMDQVSTEGWTALHLAAHSDTCEIVEYLIKERADKTMINQAGDTAQQVATGMSKVKLMSVESIGGRLRCI